MKTRVASNYAITREQKRYIAKVNMKKDGQKQFCKHSYSALENNGVTRVPSFFATNWRNYLTSKGE